MDSGPEGQPTSTGQQLGGLPPVPAESGGAPGYIPAGYQRDPAGTLAPGNPGSGPMMGGPAEMLNQLGPEWAPAATMLSNSHGGADVFRGMLDLAQNGQVPSAAGAVSDMIHAPGRLPDSAEALRAIMSGETGTPAPAAGGMPGYIPAGYQRDPSGAVTPQTTNLRTAMMAGPAFGGWRGQVT
jgi:hypothetical protein